MTAATCSKQCSAVAGSWAAHPSLLLSAVTAAVDVPCQLLKGFFSCSSDREGEKGGRKGEALLWLQLFPLAMKNRPWL